MSANARDALRALDPGMAREQWVRVCFAFKDAGGTEQEWVEWCEGGANFVLADALATFRHAKPVAGGVTSATLYMMARDAGYRPENPAPVGAAVVTKAVVLRAAKPATPEPEPVDPWPAWEACRAVDVHPYLARKRIKPHGARVSTTGALMIPYFDRFGELKTLQSIAPDGTKRFMAGAKQKGSVAQLGPPPVDAPVIVVGEGFATCAVLFEATGYPAFAAGSRGCMPEAAKIALYFSPQARVVIAADRGDLSTPIAAAKAANGFLCVPGPEDSPDGFDYADWRAKGATDAEIKANVDRAARMESEPPVRKVIAERSVHVPADPSPEGDTVSPYLLDSKGRVLPNLSNVFTLLESGALGDLRMDTFTGVCTWKGMPLKDATYTTMTRAVQRAQVNGRRPFSTKVGVQMVSDAMLEAADAHGYSSCVDWLDSLPPWDGTERIARFFSDVCELDATDYLLGVGRYFWLGLVARMVTPGTQVDSAVALVGPQGIGKSSLARIVGGERYGEATLSHMGERDWVAQLRGKILVEITELSGHSRAELETVKAILSRTQDEYRAPYRRASATIPRGCIFMATTNESEFLIDASGNRRWLPVQCRGALLLAMVVTLREQLFSEAYHVVRGGLPAQWYVVPDASMVQATHVMRDLWIDTLDEALRPLGSELPVSVSNTAICAALKLPNDRLTGPVGRRIAAVMRELGYRTERYTVAGRQVRGYVLADAQTPEDR